MSKLEAYALAAMEGMVGACARMDATALTVPSPETQATIALYAFDMAAKMVAEYERRTAAKENVNE